MELAYLIGFITAITTVVVGTALLVPVAFKKLVLKFANCHMCKQHKESRMTWDYDLDSMRPICFDCGDAEVAAGKAKPIRKGQSPIFCDRYGTGRLSHKVELS